MDEVEAVAHPPLRPEPPHVTVLLAREAHAMVPLQLLYCQLAAVGITTLYILWHRAALGQVREKQPLRERVAYMLWVAASKS